MGNNFFSLNRLVVRVPTYICSVNTPLSLLHILKKDQVFDRSRNVVDIVFVYLSNYLQWIREILSPS